MWVVRKLELDDTGRYRQVFFWTCDSHLQAKAVAREQMASDTTGRHAYNISQIDHPTEVLHVGT